MSMMAGEFSHQSNPRSMTTASSLCPTVTLANSSYCRVISTVYPEASRAAVIFCTDAAKVAGV
ncbi:hypothetical protein AHiyo8_09840 [Arthrobacter sp. Hiyo8]|nr:hypothetical protein AHiyo8_09840 [Arthrobacter sp. Hiyo8]GAP59828.1 hypothetical protein AHiyo1_32050 [Arthrobacter sp. Hiyo1]